MPLSDVIGQERAKRVLLGLMNTGRLATAYLFSGEKGIGKFKAAVEMAKALNCESVEEEDGCGHCSSCRKVDAMQHPDITVVSPEGRLISVEQVRSIEEFLSFTPYEGRKKVVIVDDADSMNRQAENAFLKTLEEPPADSIIILVSSRSESLADTVRSRCLRVRFNTLSENELRNVAVSADLEVDDAKLRFAMGRVGRLLDDEALAKRDEALDVFIDMLKGIEVTAPKERETIDEILDHFILFVRDMAVSACSGEDAPLINPDLPSDVLKLGKEIDIKVIIDIYEELMNLRKRTAFNLNKSIVFNYMSVLVGSIRQRKEKDSAR
ncbi:MAG: DNA polymerase III subunit delta' [Nitrospirota bacterium]|nr:MAG: DNA polymerase III subunit delta' [Nitrospirota bacterium]